MDTRECVGSIVQSDYRNLTTWGVDNGSEQDPSVLIAQEYPNVRVIRNPSNLGYSGGNNVALRMALEEQFEYAVILNNDVVIAPDTISKLVFVAEANPRIGTLALAFIGITNPIGCTGVVDWENGDMFHESASLCHLNGLIVSKWQDGCAFLIRADTLRDIGLLDERYFLYYEDVEWSIRASRRNWVNAVLPSAKAWHKVSRSSGGLGNPLTRYYFTRNRFLFLQTHKLLYQGTWGIVRYARRAFWDYWWLKDRADQRRAVLEGFWSLLRHRWGEYHPSCQYEFVIRVADSVLFCLTVIGSGVRRAGLTILSSFASLHPADSNGEDLKTK